MEVRINKYLSSAGYCSRREADRLLEQGRVTIDGIPAQMGSKVTEGQTVFVDGKSIIEEDEKILLAFYKPTGIVCTTTANQGDNNIVDYIGYPKRIYPVGRLDKDSEGLILMTNNGEMMDKILRSANGHEKEYIDTVNKEIEDSFIKAMSRGIYLAELDRTTETVQSNRIGKENLPYYSYTGIKPADPAYVQYTGKGSCAAQKNPYHEYFIGRFKARRIPECDRSRISAVKGAVI